MSLPHGAATPNGEARAGHPDLIPCNRGCLSLPPVGGTRDSARRLRSRASIVPRDCGPSMVRVAVGPFCGAKDKRWVAARHSFWPCRPSCRHPAVPRLKRETPDQIVFETPSFPGLVRSRICAISSCEMGLRGFLQASAKARTCNPLSFKCLANPSSHTREGHADEPSNSVPQTAEGLCFALAAISTRRRSSSCSRALHSARSHNSR